MTKFTELKKTIAGVLAFAMAFSPMVSTVSAADVTSVPGQKVVSAEGGLEGYAEQKVTDVVLPTISGNQLAFKLDPQGLLSISGNGYEKYTNVQAGDLVFTNKVSSNEVSVSSNLNQSNVMYATNKSTYDVTISADIAMTNVSTNKVTFVSSESAVSSNDKLNLYVAAVPEKEFISYNKVSSNAFVALAPNAADTTYAQALNTDGKAGLSFRVSGNKANYTTVRNVSDSNVSYNFQQKTGATGWQTVGFSLKGLCNPNANWKAFNTAGENLKLTLTWNVTEAGTTTVYSDNSDCPKGMIKYTAPAANNSEPDYAGATSFNLTKNGSGTALYAAASSLPFAVGDISTAKVKIDDADYANFTDYTVANSNFKINCPTTWGSARSVKVYFVTAAKVYVVTYK